MNGRHCALGVNYVTLTEASIEAYKYLSSLAGGAARCLLMMPSLSY